MPLDEINPGEYSGNYRIAPGMKLENASFAVQMKPSKGRTVKVDSKAKISVWDNRIPIIGMTTTNRSGIVPGLHTVRLGGPFMTESPMSTKFEIIGQDGGNYKIKLSPSMIGWIDVDNVQILPHKNNREINIYTSRFTIALCRTSKYLGPSISAQRLAL